MPGEPDGDQPSLEVFSLTYDDGSLFGTQQVLGLFGAGEETVETLAIDNIHSRVAFDLWQIDSWEREQVRV